MSEFYIFGAGGHAASIADAIISNGWEIKAFIDETGSKTTFLNFPVVNSIEKVSLENSNIAIAIGDNSQRKKVVDRLKKTGSFRFPPVVHKTAYTGLCSTYGEGTVILAGANIGANSHLGDFVILNSGSSLDHDSLMGDCSSLAPSAVTGGLVKIGDFSAIGIGAVLRHSISIGEHTVIGSASLVNDSIPHEVIAFGVPCKIIRTREIGSPYL